MTVFLYIGIAGIQAGNSKSMLVLQEKNISGTVTDEEGVPMPGVNVVIKGTTRGSITDSDGKYNISVPDAGAVLVFSFTGYASREFTVADQSVINVTLNEDSLLVQEVVVTALGLKREKKALGYAMQEVKTEGLLETKTESVANMLQGKVAGVQINKSSSGVGGSTRIIMRGLNSLTGNNQPMWVVDGIPIRDDAPNASFDNWSGSDAAGAASEINPDDIESISVLKGPNAAALYGSRAQNGVIVITTKGARQEQPVSVTYNGNFNWDKMYGGYDFQWEYGQGNQGAFSMDSKESWGPKMTGQMIENWRKKYYNEDAADYAMNAQKNRIKDFFRTGFNTSNSVAVEGGGKDLASRLSFTDSRNQGITPGNDLRRQYFDVNTNLKYENLTVNAKATYSRQTQENPIAMGEYGLMQMFTKMPPNIRTEDLLNNMTFDEVPMNWSGPSNEYSNPYNYVSNIRESIQKRDRLFGVISLNYKFTDWLGISARTGMDRITNNNYSHGTKGTNGTNPTYYKSYQTITETNSDIMLNFNKTFGRFSVLANAGSSLMNLRTDGLSANSGQVVLYGFYRLANGSLVSAGDYTSEKEIQSVLGNAQFAYNNYLYLDITARNDWSSTLPKENRSYFYPSVSLSGIISDMISMPEQITFLKLRASWAQVGNDTDPYRLSPAYSMNKLNGNINWVDIGLTKVADDLKPEQTSSMEFGFDFRMFHNRIGLDFTYYNSNTVNQILSLSIPQSSGYTSKFINAGKMKSSGLEIMLNTTPVETKSFRWDLNFNWGTNKSECIELYTGIQRHVLGSLRIGEVVVMEGGRYGDIRSKVFLRDNNGRILIDDNGLPLKSRHPNNMTGIYFKAFIVVYF
jgi:TonB-linked SusC/RagA family outer membrane protein